MEQTGRSQQEKKLSARQDKINELKEKGMKQEGIQQQQPQEAAAMAGG